MSKVLITGAAGFIGSNLVERSLFEEGWDITGVDDLSNGHTAFIQDKKSGAFIGKQFYKIDFADEQVLSMVKRGEFDYIVHLAAIPRVSYSVQHPIETNDVNVTKTLQLIHAARKHVKRFVFASSSSVYGGAAMLPTPESCPKNPKSPYALQKSIIEDYLKLYNNLYSMESVCLRFFNVFGKNQLGNSPYSTAISSWLTAILSNRPMRSDGDGTQTRDMCHVDNVTDACIRAVKSEKSLGALRINIACGERTSNNAIMEFLKQRYPNATRFDAEWRAGDVRHTQADVSLARELLGYTPKVRIFEGLEKTIEWAENSPEFLQLGVKK